MTGHGRGRAYGSGYGGKAGNGVGIGIGIGLALLLGFAAPAFAQSRWISVRPVIAIAEGGDAAFGARWAGAFEPGEQTTLAASFPRETWWGARGEGAWVSKAGATTEPLVNGEAEFGMQVLLLKQRPCLPDTCPEDLVDFDLGYVVIAARAQTETDRSFDEALLAAGATLLYRPNFSWSLESVGFLVPTISIGVGAAWPLRSVLRDSLDLEKTSYTRFDLEADWTIRLEREFVPSALRPLRFDVHFAHYTHGSVEEPIADVVGTSGNFIAFDAGYELTGRVPFFRHAFVRWSDGEHATLPAGRKGWLIGLTIGSTRN
ncbi:MAG: hypothetical protein L0271_16820 [Gemmatimonadetes bacterium]|nr:hypothetical protein [Gemmatimonadota bacterium]